MVPTIVGLYIAAAYWFTASTSFANPAVTIARALTDTFTGIAPASVPAFIAAQTSGALVGLVLSVWLFGQPVTRGEQT
jgi:glycerol uptake facilitator-like aquaporin